MTAAEVVDMFKEHASVWLSVVSAEDLEAYDKSLNTNVNRKRTRLARILRKKEGKKEILSDSIDKAGTYALFGLDSDVLTQPQKADTVLIATTEREELAFLRKARCV